MSFLGVNLAWFIELQGGDIKPTILYKITHLSDMFQPCGFIDDFINFIVAGFDLGDKLLKTCSDLLRYFR